MTVGKRTSVDIWFEFEKENGREPTREEFEQLGYHPKYYFQVRRKIRDMKEAKVIKSVQVENETLIFN